MNIPSVSNRGLAVLLLRNDGTVATAFQSFQVEYSKRGSVSDYFQWIDLHRINRLRTRRAYYYKLLCWLDMVCRIGRFVNRMSMKGERLGRQKRYPDSKKTINAFYTSVSDAYNHPGIDEKSRDGQKTQALLAEEFGISRLKARNILITTRDVVYPETKRIQELLAGGLKKQDVCETLVPVTMNNL